MEGRLFTRTREMHITVEGEEKKEKTRNIENQYNLGECHRIFPISTKMISQRRLTNEANLSLSLSEISTHRSDTLGLDLLQRQRYQRNRGNAIREESSISLSIPGLLTFPFRRNVNLTTKVSRHWTSPKRRRRRNVNEALLGSQP